MQYKVELIKNNIKSAFVSQGESLYDVLIAQGIDFSAPCGGKCLCGKCKVQVTGHISQPSQEELAFLSGDDIKNNIRLACAVRILGDVSVNITSNTGAKILDSGFMDSVTPDRGTGIGVAIDIGTTTVVVYLYDLSTGKRLAVASGMNAQRAIGADVISRINFVQSIKDTEQLQSIIINQLQELLLQAFIKINRAINETKIITIVGNTTMQHAAIGLDITPIGVSPYQPVTLEPISTTTLALGMQKLPNLPVEFVGNISGFVGADIVAGILSSGMYKRQDNVLLIDIGTNGEMVLGTKGKLLCCSTAAGPAFEGANIRCGCAGVSGAINSIDIKPEGITFGTIDNLAPIGICGSAVIDAVFQLLQLGAITSGGRMLPISKLPQDIAHLFGTIDDEYGLIISKEHKIFITPNDIRELQLAKASIAAGIASLCCNAQLSIEDISDIYIAGGFGAHIDKLSAVGIGLLPQSGIDKIKFLGNSAGAGAIMTALSKEMLQKCEDIRLNCTYIELADTIEFQDFYMDNMAFPI